MHHYEEKKWKIGACQRRRCGLCVNLSEVGVASVSLGEAVWPMCCLGEGGVACVSVLLKGVWPLCPSRYRRRGLWEC